MSSSCELCARMATRHLSICLCLSTYFPSYFDLTVSAVMCLNMSNLEEKVKAREVIADKLEKTRAIELATGKSVAHR